MKRQCYTTGCKGVMEVESGGDLFLTVSCPVCGTEHEFYNPRAGLIYFRRLTGGNAQIEKTAEWRDGIGKRFEVAV